jgi:hypothetical protein
MSGEIEQANTNELKEIKFYVGMQVPILPHQVTGYKACASTLGEILAMEKGVPSSIVCLNRRCNRLVKINPDALK